MIRSFYLQEAEMRKFLSTLILALLFTPALFAASDCPPDKAVPEGFISLFDGKTLDGWDADLFQV